MSTSEYDSLRPPEPVGKRTGKRRKGVAFTRRGAGDGSREMPMVPEVEFTTYYGRPVVKPAPWGREIGAYLFLGGVAGGSGRKQRSPAAAISIARWIASLRSAMVSVRCCASAVAIPAMIWPIMNSGSSERGLSEVTITRSA